jgi:hypothetical protein
MNQQGRNVKIKLKRLKLRLNSRKDMDGYDDVVNSSF